MSTLEKTINLLYELPGNQVEMIYHFARFLESQETEEKPVSEKSLEEIFENIVGIVPDSGKTLEEYRAERLKEQYEPVD